MARNRIKGIKYNRVSKQQKFILLHSILKDHFTISEAAIKAKMHYSTAKAILFFHKHNHKIYFTSPVESHLKPQSESKIHAGYVEKKNMKYPLLYEPINIISRVIQTELNDNPFQSQSQWMQKLGFPMNDNKGQRQMLLNNSAEKVDNGQDRQAQLWKQKSRSIINIQSSAKILQRKETQQCIQQNQVY